MNSQALQIASQIQEKKEECLPVIQKLLNTMQKQSPHYIELIFLEKTKYSYVFISYNAKLRDYVMLQIFEAKYKINEQVRDQEIDQLFKSSYSQFIKRSEKKLSLIEYFITIEDTKRQKIIHSNFDQEGVQQRDIFWIYEFFLNQDIFFSESHSKIIFEQKKQKEFSLKSIDQQWVNVKILKVNLDETAKLGDDFQGRQLVNLFSSSQRKLGQELALCQNLFSLNLQLNKALLSQAALQEVGNGISQCQELFIINIQLFNRFEIENEGDFLIDLFKGICACQKLASLTADLSFCNLSSDGAINIGKEISKCINLTTISFNLQGNSKLSQNGCSLFVQNIQKCINIDFLLLNFRDCDAGSKAASGIAQKISKCSKITNLNLDFSNSKIDQLNIQNLTQSIKSLTSMISLTLGLSNCKIGNSGITYIGQMISSFTNLEELNLDIGMNAFKPEKIVELSEYLQQNKDIHTLKLNLNKNDLNYKNISEAFNNLSKYKFLDKLSLNLSSNILGKCILNIAQELQKFENLVYLDLDLQNISMYKDYLERIFSSLSALRKLKTLNLNISQNKLNETDGTNIGNSLQQFSSLNNLNLNFENTSCSFEMFRYMLISLKNKSKINFLTIKLENEQQRKAFIKDFRLSLKRIPSLLRYQII
ncbi:kinase domain protein, putative (macronuclear) [Tetrahymena thermophila SB210]|uniref:Kinase domain protein, putative n=1 Tax=Tetrahymena thermophila (strain SB210) TaxID=312017 RepID=Q22T16_TETTS|nr:kinase domain protein, putative [Tetrahymena thermophila SB210]EAR88622.2 kinase domain protein, putative [Tetrahymena thermophila SB210]|eukprot:XP_001008867.2 kinase domain protein, putative [Tetrahymena thermophila SB210]